MIILLDGPEKAGKTTLVAELRRRLGPRTLVRHWGPTDPDDRIYTQPLLQDASYDGWVIWDRGWPSEHVYGRLLRRDRRLARDPFLGEWLHGRVALSRGFRIILLPHNVDELFKRRAVDDLLVDPNDEYEAFLQYGQEYKYKILHNDYTLGNLHNNVATIYLYAKILEDDLADIKVDFPQYVGPVDPQIVFVGEKMDKSFIPFSSDLNTEIGRRVGNKALEFGWTNVGDVPLEFLRDKKIVTCGKAASAWIVENFPDKQITSIPHPAWLYRYHTARKQEIRKSVDELLTKLGEN